MNDSPICDQDYSHGKKLFFFEEKPSGICTLTIPAASKLQEGRLCIIAENEAGRAVSACNLHVAGE